MRNAVISKNTPHSGFHNLSYPGKYKTTSAAEFQMIINFRVSRLAELY